MKTVFSYVTLMCFILALNSCHSDNVQPKKMQSDVVDSTKAIRNLHADPFSHPAVWNISSGKTLVHKLISANYNNYYFSVIDSGNYKSQIVGATEGRSPHRDYALSLQSKYRIIDLYYVNKNDGALLTIGGLDLENIYKSAIDIDEGGFSSLFSDPDTIRYGNYATVFTGIARGDYDLYSDFDSYFIIGNAYTDTHVSHPFITTLKVSEFYNQPPSLSKTASFFEDKVGLEFIKMSYDYTKNLYVVAYDPAKKEVSIILYKYTGPDNDLLTKNYFAEQWHVSLNDIILTKDLANFIYFGPSIYVAGTVKTPAGDTAGKLMAFDKKDGHTIFEHVLDYSDSLDGFHGVTFTGANIFAYGYSHGIRSAAGGLSLSRGWAVQFSNIGKQMLNYTYNEVGSQVEFTAVCQGSEYSSFKDYGYLAIGGSRTHGGSSQAFATQLVFDYRNN